MNINGQTRRKSEWSACHYHIWMELTIRFENLIGIKRKNDEEHSESIDLII